VFERVDHVAWFCGVCSVGSREANPIKDVIGGL
jgi:hypothetical protein